MRETLMSIEWFIPTSQALLDFRHGNKLKSSDRHRHKSITTSNRHRRISSSRNISSSSSSNPIISSNVNNKTALTIPIR